MNTERESLQSQLCGADKEGRPDPYDPRGVLSQLLGENQELRELVVQTRQMQLGQAAHMEELEKRIKILESGGY